MDELGHIILAMTNVWTTVSVEETKALAAALATALRAGDVVVLNGGLGAGKTHFVQGVAEALGILQPVTSPTFNILQTYAIPLAAAVGDGVNIRQSAELPEGQDTGLAEGQGKGLAAEQDKTPAPMGINHFDLYRLESAEELDDIGYWEMLESGGASFIEWGEKFPESMPEDYLEVRMTVNEDGTRIIQVLPYGFRSESLLSAWTQNIAN